MTLRFSTGLVDSLQGNASLKGTDLAYVDGGAGDDKITDSQNRFLTAGFKVGDEITTTGSTTGGNDISGVALTAVTAGQLSFATGTLAASESFAAGTIVTGNNGGDFKTLFTDGVLEIYSGAQPADADDAETGTKLVRITVSSGAFTPGSPTNGLEFREIISGMISKNSDVWSGVGLATGTAGWFRFYDNNYHSGAVISAVRFDGSVGTSGADLILPSTSIVLNATTTIDTFNLTLPMTP